MTKTNKVITPSFIKAERYAPDTFNHRIPGIGAKTDNNQSSKQYLRALKPQQKDISHGMGASN